jgi:DNA-binding NarL/FixJ family response regulator
MYEPSNWSASSVPVRPAQPPVRFTRLLPPKEQPTTLLQPVLKPRSKRILIADDQEFVRLGLASVIHRLRPGWEIVGMAIDGRDAIRMAEELKPDLAVVELGLPEIDGVTVIERLLRASPQTRVMVFTMHPAAQLVRPTRKLGAGAFVSKQEPPANLVTAMERVMAGEPFFTSDRVVSIFAAEESSVRHPTALPSQYLLTSREQEVLRALAGGATNKQTAEALKMSVRTAESHRANILHKLGAASLADLVRIALRDGLI